MHSNGASGEWNIFKYFLKNLYECFAGLFGNNGILPASIYTNTTTSTLTAFIRTPTLLHFGFIFGLDAEHVMDLISILGILLAGLGYAICHFCIACTTDDNSITFQIYFDSPVPHSIVCHIVDSILFLVSNHRRIWPSIGSITLRGRFCMHCVGTVALK